MRAATDDVMRIKRQLVKEIEGSKDQSRLMELLHALQDIPMTIELLKATEIGKVVANVRKNAEGDPSNTARELIRRWKESTPAVAAAKSSPTESAAKASAPARPPASAEPKSSRRNGGADEKPALERASSDGEELEFKVVLPSMRQKVVDLLTRCLEVDVRTKIAQAIAFSVENEIHRLFNSEVDRERYTAKARMLKANLTQNGGLRAALCTGEVSADRLVDMSPEDMATDEQRQERQSAKNDDMEARRSDWLAANREKIQKSLGLEGKGGEFVCHKCKQNKTTHYAQQTRSADEPMTIFVTCLTCGARWKTS